LSWLFEKVGKLGGVVGTAATTRAGCSPTNLPQRGPGLRARRRPKTLFPTVEVALAYRLLLGMTTGIVPDGLDELELDDVEWAG
jgi:hypothetical protein